MTRNAIPRMILSLGLGVALSWGALSPGCNPKFTNSLGVGRAVPATPGPNPYIVLRFTNSVVGPDQSPAEPNVPAAANFEATWRYAGGGKDFFGWIGDSLRAGEDIGTMLPCDITVMTAGDVDDLTAWGAWISFNPPGEDPVRQPLPPMGKLLTNGVDFRCGDVVTFMLAPNDAIPQRYSITWRVDSGQNESGPYSGPDTFANCATMSKKWEQETGITIPYPYIP